MAGSRDLDRAGLGLPPEQSSRCVRFQRSPRHFSADSALSSLRPESLRTQSNAAEIAERVSKVCVFGKREMKSMNANFGLRCVLAALIFLGSVGRLPAQAAASFDLVITNGHIIDGTGSPWYSG